MECIKCYTLKDAVVDGIAVDAFESIICDPETAVLKKAVIQTIPLIDSKLCFDTAQEAQIRLYFVKQSTKNDTVTSSHALIAVDPAKWKLPTDKYIAKLIDPCGLTGLILLLIQRTPDGILLINSRKRDTCLCFTADRPSIEKQSRAALLLEALTEAHPELLLE